MSKKSRYLIILAGFITFCILAPLIVLFVTGTSYNFNNGDFVKTGILALRSEPNDPRVFLNDKLERESDGDIRFLNPGEYNLSLKKEGYFDWYKKLEIKEKQVTWANPENNKIYLFLKPSSPGILAGNILDFALAGNDLLYINNGLLSSSPIGNPGQSQNFNLPKPVSQIKLSPNGQLLLLIQNRDDSAFSGNTLIFNRSGGTFSDITGLLPKFADYKFSPDNQLFALDAKNLYQIDFKNNKKTPLLKNIDAFSFEDGNLYYLRQGNSASSLLITGDYAQEGTEVTKNIPLYQKAEIIVNFEKDIFLVLDNSLYQLGAEVRKIADNLDSWNFNPNESTLIFSHSGELSYYNPFEKKIKFITRSSEKLTSPAISLIIDEAFTFSGNTLTALELDTRDHQNTYTFYQASNPKKLLLTPDVKTVLFLDSGELKSLKIR